MTPNFLHLKESKDALEPVLREWFGRPNLDFDSVLEDNSWITITADCDFLDTREWSKLGRHVDLIYESYSTSLRMGELVIIRNRELVRHFLHHESEDGNEYVNVGKLKTEATTPLKSWTDVWAFVDDCRWISET